MHNGMMQLSGAAMSKSTGNLVTIPNSMLLQRTVIKLERGNEEFPSKVFPPAPETSPARPRKSAPAKKRAPRSATKTAS